MSPDRISKILLEIKVYPLYRPWGQNDSKCEGRGPSGCQILPETPVTQKEWGTLIEKGFVTGNKVQDAGVKYPKKYFFNLKLTDEGLKYVNSNEK